MVLLTALLCSFVFDWQVRIQGINHMTFGPLRAQPVPSPDQVRHLLPVALAALEPDWLRAEAAAACDTQPGELEWWQARGRLDASVFAAYSLSLDEAAYILSTFPLLDRQQPPLPGEHQSTVTRDLVLAETARQLGEPDPDLEAIFGRVGVRPPGSIGRAGERADAALELGAVPYVVEPKADYFTEWAEDEVEDSEE
jgi:hypothetical protein